MPADFLFLGVCCCDHYHRVAVQRLQSFYAEMASLYRKSGSLLVDLLNHRFVVKFQLLKMRYETRVRVGPICTPV